MCTTNLWTVTGVALAVFIAIHVFERAWLKNVIAKAVLQVCAVMSCMLVFLAVLIPCEKTANASDSDTESVWADEKSMNLTIMFYNALLVLFGCAFALFGATAALLSDGRFTASCLIAGMVGIDVFSVLLCLNTFVTIIFEAIRGGKDAEISFFVSWIVVGLFITFESVSMAHTSLRCLSDVLRRRRRANRVVSRVVSRAYEPRAINDLRQSLLVESASDEGGRVVGMPTKTHVEDWTTDDVVQWTRHIGLGQYSEMFVECAVDGKMLLDETCFTRAECRALLGIRNSLHLKKFMRELSDLRRRFIPEAVLCDDNALPTAPVIKGE